jgi:hypothetical protein
VPRPRLPSYTAYTRPHGGTRPGCLASPEDGPPRPCGARARQRAQPDDGIPSPRTGREASDGGGERPARCLTRQEPFRAPAPRGREARRLPEAVSGPGAGAALAGAGASSSPRDHEAAAPISRQATDIRPSRQLAPCESEDASATNAPTHAIIDTMRASLRKGHSGRPAMWFRAISVVWSCRSPWNSSVMK